MTSASTDGIMYAQSTGEHKILNLSEMRNGDRMQKILYGIQLVSDPRQPSMKENILFLDHICGWIRQ
jgi:hypothetical protein